MVIYNLCHLLFVVSMLGIAPFAYYVGGMADFDIPNLMFQLAIITGLVFIHGILNLFAIINRDDRENLRKANTQRYIARIYKDGRQTLTLKG